MSWIKNIWERVLIIWGAVYVAFCYVFEPSKAWGAVWSIFAASFVTKMFELAYDADKKKMSWAAFRSRFSSTTALLKMAGKSALYLLLMFGVARAGSVYPDSVLNYARSIILSIAFTIEFTNAIQHLSVFPGLSRYAKIFGGAVKKTIMPKEFDDLDTE